MAPEAKCWNDKMKRSCDRNIFIVIKVFDLSLRKILLDNGDYEPMLLGTLLLIAMIPNNRSLKKKSDYKRSGTQSQTASSLKNNLDLQAVMR